MVCIQYGLLRSTPWPQGPRQTPRLPFFLSKRVVVKKKKRSVHIQSTGAMTGRIQCLHLLANQHQGGCFSGNCGAHLVCMHVTSICLTIDVRTQKSQQTIHYNTYCTLGVVDLQELYSCIELLYLLFPTWDIYSDLLTAEYIASIIYLKVSSLTQPVQRISITPLSIALKLDQPLKNKKKIETSNVVVYNCVDIGVQT